MDKILIDILQDWKTKKEVLLELEKMGILISERHLRHLFQQFNKNYGVESDLFIAHCDKGYKVTTNKDEIFRSLLDQKQRALKMLKQYYTGIDVLSNELQISLDFDNDASLRDIVMKGF